MAMTLIHQMRVHHWVKNILVFVPLIASHQVTRVDLLMATMLSFLAFGFCASAVYVMNDLLDLEDDRAHPSKRHRPLAAGRISENAARILAAGLAFAALGIAAWISLRVAGLLTIYGLLNIGYSRLFKEIPIVDVLLLAGFYTLRLLVGSAATGIVLTPWLLAFSMFVFFSLALAKRVSELRAKDASKFVSKESRRGYAVSDIQLLTSMGASAGQLAALVFALYINSEEMVRLYRNPALLWFVCLAIFFWNMRVWFAVDRGRMHDDPIVFALKDRVSYAVGAACALMVYLASV
jgi:4-hydroxybenzoate polyprenyltransferase